MPVNIQDSYFASLLESRKHITIFLVSGVKISGKVQSYDKYTVVLDSGPQQQLIFKHSISTVFPCRNKQCAECAADQPRAS